MDQELIKMAEEFAPTAISFGISLIVALLIFIVGKWLARRISGLVVAAMDKKGVDPTVKQFVGNLTNALLMAMVLVVVLSQLGVETASLIAVLGAAGLAVGLALQGSLSNFASGVLLIVLRPCRVGDYVEAGGCAGTISQIDILATTMVTPDNKVITVPNSCIMGSPIVNYSAMDTRRVDLTLGVSYDADLAQTKQLLLDLLAADQRILKDPGVTVEVVELADSSVNFVVRPWVKKEDYWGVYFDLQREMKLSMDKNGISIPFPQMDLHVEKLINE